MYNTMSQYQNKVKQKYIDREYTSDLLTLGLGLAEEAGEVCAAINDRNKIFKPKDSRSESDLEHELHDCLVYLCAIANAAGIDLGI